MFWDFARTSAIPGRASIYNGSSGGGSETPLFVGDYSTNDFSQWPVIQNIYRNGSGSGYTTQQYPATTISDGTYGHAARYEVRDGDIPFASGERSEVSAGAGSTFTGGNEGDIRWYRFATKFDATFPNDHITYNGGNGWGVVNQWHGTGSEDGVPITLGFRPWGDATPTGYWSLTVCRMDSSGAVLTEDARMHLPMNTGSWNEIKMQVCWSSSDVTGFIRVWLNGVAQTFIGGGTTLSTRTMIPGQGPLYYKEGYYRNDALTWTAIVYHAGFKAAVTEAGLDG